MDLPFAIALAHLWLEIDGRAKTTGNVSAVLFRDVVLKIQEGGSKTEQPRVAKNTAGGLGRAVSPTADPGPGPGGSSGFEAPQKF